MLSYGTNKKQSWMAEELVHRSLFISGEFKRVAQRSSNFRVIILFALVRAVFPYRIVFLLDDGRMKKTLILLVIKKIYYFVATG
jgi:hypothetical protein